MELTEAIKPGRIEVFGNPGRYTEIRTTPPPAALPEHTVIYKVYLPPLLELICREHDLVTESESAEANELQWAWDKSGVIAAESPRASWHAALTRWNEVMAEGGDAGAVPRLEDFELSVNHKKSHAEAERAKIAERTWELAKPIFERIRPHLEEFVANYVAKEKVLAAKLGLRAFDPIEHSRVACALQSSILRLDKLLKSGWRGEPRLVLAGIAFPVE